MIPILGKIVDQEVTLAAHLQHSYRMISMRQGIWVLGEDFLPSVHELLLSSHPKRKLQSFHSDQSHHTWFLHFPNTFYPLLLCITKQQPKPTHPGIRSMI